MTRKKQPVVVHRFGYICNRCDSLHWYNTKTGRNVMLEKHIQNSSRCRKLDTAKCDSQDVPSGLGRV